MTGAERVGGVRPRSLVLLANGVAGVSSSAVLVRLTAAPALAIGFWRNTLAVAVLAPIAMVRHRGEVRTLSRRSRGLLVAAGALLALHFALWIPSLALTGVAASTVLVTTTPVWVALIGRVVLGERVGRTSAVGIAVAIVGAIVITGGDLGDASGRAVAGDLLALGGAIAAAGYVVLGRSLRRSVSLPVYATSVYAVAATVLAAAMLVTGTPFAGYAPEVWGLFAAMAAGPQLLGHTVFNLLLGELDAWIVALAVTAEPVGATILGFLVLGEVPSGVEVVGGLLTLTGIAVALAATERGTRTEITAA
jgi:drug/metabolite transporter (DMT)-like permease